MLPYIAFMDPMGNNMLTFNVTFDINIGMEWMEEALMYYDSFPSLGL